MQKDFEEGSIEYEDTISLNARARMIKIFSSIAHKFPQNGRFVNEFAKIRNRNKKKWKSVKDHVPLANSLSAPL